MVQPGLSLLTKALLAGDFAAVRARIRHHLGERGRRTLDLACGPGLFADLFAGEDYVGLDPDLRNVAWARRARPGAFLVATPPWLSVSWKPWPMSRWRASSASCDGSWVLPDAPSS